VTLSEEQLRRLARLLNMMGSSHDGEVFNAARAAQRFLGSVGATMWEEVLLHNSSTPGANAKWTDEDLVASINKSYQDGYAAARADAKGEALKAFADADSCPAFARLCLTNYKHLLSGWEIDFCEDWAVKPEYARPSDRQIAIFQRLARKVGLTLPAEAD
jgi:hypothetical protein